MPARRSPSSPRPEVPRVALLLETSTTWGMSMAHGIAQYAQDHGPWRFFLEPRGLYERLSLPEGWVPDGIIARVLDEQMAKEIEKTGIPAVNVSWTPYIGKGMARCTIDCDMVGEMAAQLFLDRGIRHAAFVGPEHRRVMDMTPWPSFERALAKRGVTCELLAHTGSGLNEKQTWVEKLETLGAWLKQLPKPTGILAFRPMEARLINDACQEQAIHVPEEIAILAAEDDELTVAITSPPISSIDIGGERLGYRAASILEDMMAGNPAPKEPVLLPPQSLVARQSTDVMMIDDILLSKALTYIHEHYREPITVESILDVVQISRRALEQRFKQYLGRSPADEIRRKRLEHAVRLLFDTNMKISTIAQSCGFNHAEVMGRLFRREFGESPSDYRARIRSGRR